MNGLLFILCLVVVGHAYFVAHILTNELRMQVYFCYSCLCFILQRYAFSFTQYYQVPEKIYSLCHFCHGHPSYPAMVQ